MPWLLLLLRGSVSKVGTRKTRMGLSMWFLFIHVSIGRPSEGRGVPCGCVRGKGTLPDLQKVWVAVAEVTLGGMIERKHALLLLLLVVLLGGIESMVAAEVGSEDDGVRGWELGERLWRYWRGRRGTKRGLRRVVSAEQRGDIHCADVVVVVVVAVVVVVDVVAVADNV